MHHLVNLRVWLDSLDGPVVIGRALFVFALLWLVCAVVDHAVRRLALPRGPRPESPSERHHRLDAEARAATRPVHSGRKAGRTAVTR